MIGFPSKTTMIISILILTVYTSFHYSSKLSGQHFQLKFDWNKEKIIQQAQNLSVDSLSYNYLKLSHLPDNFKVDNQNTYSLNLSNHKKFYFRFINYSKEKNTIIFSAVEWLTGVPDPFTAKVSLTESDIPLIRNNGETIVTIGDEFLIKDEAKYFRREIAAKTNFNFDGSASDVFNYKHEAAYNLNLIGLAESIMRSPDSEFYIISINSNPEILANQNLQNDLNQLVEVLANRQKTKKIIWINTPFVKNKNQNELNKNLNRVLSGLKNKKLVLLDAFSLFEHEKSDYLMADGVHLNKFGYLKLADQTIELLK